MTPICVYKQVCSTPKFNGENVSAPNRHLFFSGLGGEGQPLFGGELGGCNLHLLCSGNVMFKKSFTNDPTTQVSLYTPPKFNIDPEQMVVGRLFSYWKGNFQGLC